ncbi:MAG TPA: serine hydrolase domain-containing protein, partial [Pyrinomonadaceae bacterium]|nr:serine hydrolase domain-containing protein [Pyrinomonadaceae bacterium]
MRTTIALLTIALVFALCVMGQAPIQPKPVTEDKSPPLPSSSATHEMSAADVEAFLDGIVPLQLQRNDIAGATIAVVKDGRLLFAKGYGYADVKSKKPVSPDETLFRPGSISKLFTWTA